MNSIKITFSPPLSDMVTGNWNHWAAETGSYLQKQLIAELDAEIKANASANADFIRRRAEAGHLKWEVAEMSGEGLSLHAEPWPRFAGAFDHSESLCRIWLQEKMRLWIRENSQVESVQAGVSLSEWPVQNRQESPQAGTNRSGGSSGSVFRRVALLMFALVLGSLAFTLYKVVRMVDDVQQSYSAILETVDHKTDKILDKVGQGITTTDKVVNMVDKVKGLVVPADSLDR
jgi:hypothetical protein